MNILFGKEMLYCPLPVTIQISISLVLGLSFANLSWQATFKGKVTPLLFLLSYYFQICGHFHTRGHNFRDAPQAPGLFWSCLYLLTHFFPFPFTSPTSIFTVTGLVPVVWDPNLLGLKFIFDWWSAPFFSHPLLHILTLLHP